MKRKWWKALIFVLPAIVAAVWGMKDTKAAARLRYALDIQLPAPDDDFSKLAAMKSGAGAKIASLHKALDQDGYLGELRHYDTLSIHGYRFIAEPEKFDEEFRRTLLEVLSNTDTYRPHAGPKWRSVTSAGFAVILNDDGIRRELVVSAGEVMMFSGGEELICALDPAAAKKLQGAWLYRQGYDPLVAASRASRFPLEMELLTKWGVQAREITSDRTLRLKQRTWEEKRFGRASVRQQAVVPARERADKSSGSGVITLVEETYRNKEEAEKRAKEFRELPGHYTVATRPEHFFRDGFAQGAKVYFVAASDEALSREVPRLQSLLRAYCEETPLVNRFRGPIPE